MPSGVHIVSTTQSPVPHALVLHYVWIHLVAIDGLMHRIRGKSFGRGGRESEGNSVHITGLSILD